ncbi:cytochrome c oxidase subunit 3 [candidate division KSB1 bacterium]|nr:cytochrome c oxidase subunit 3 [candidate division KSB1 bacterium]
MVQGYEWLRLLDFGLKLSSGVFGATFYILIGCHALHVIGAVIWLSAVSLRIRLSSHAFDERRIESVKLIGMYWFLVVALWPILYGLVYWS